MEGATRIKLSKAKLTTDQRDAVLTWVAEGLSLLEIRARAAEFDPPFEIEYRQVKHLRQRAGVKYRQIQEEIEAELIGEGLARKALRIKALTDLFDRHLSLIQSRADDPAMAEVTGGDTGLIVLDYKHNNPVYKFDSAVIKEMRGLLDDIAREKGDRHQKVELSDPNGEPLFESLAKALEKAYGGES